MSTPSLRTRFAPSPTGFLHLGSARTALFNWAYARRHGGTFVLRIEDTDRERSTRESEDAVLDGMNWLGLDCDEGPFRQSERRGHHAEAVEQLLAAGRAYRCVCTREELEERRQKEKGGQREKVYDGRCRDVGLGPDCGEHTVRLRLPEHSRLEWNDLVYGPSGQSAAEIGDVILRRSDGSPLYNLAVVVDDRDMRITHVVRGADHIANTPIQIAIYRALDAPLPEFAHLPLIVGTSGKKLSKRRDPVSIQQFRQEGYLAEALRSWLARLGWSHGDQEIFSAEDLVSLFDLENVGRSSAQADIAKLQWTNQQYILGMPREELIDVARPFLEEVAGRSIEITAELERLIDLLRERSKTLVELAEHARFVLCDDIEMDEKATKKHLKPAAAPILRGLREALEKVELWDEATLETAFEQVREAQGGVSMGKLAQPTRVAITGSAASPGIYETLAVVGRSRTLARMKDAIARIEASASDVGPA